MSSFILTIIFILLVIIIFYVIIQKTAPDLKNYVEVNKKKLKWKSLDYLLKNANNGDLIFMSGDTYGERTCRYFTNCMYSHVGMLFRENHPETGEDILYIWDSDLGQRTKDGPRVQNFTDKIEKYHGYKYLMWRRLNLRFSPKGTNLEVNDDKDKPSTENILKVVRKYGNYSFDNKMLSWWVSDIPFLYNVIKNTHSLFCSELIAATMQDENIGMMDKEKLPSGYSPKPFTKKKIPGLKSNYTYSSKIFVEF